MFDFDTRAWADHHQRLTGTIDTGLRRARAFMRKASRAGDVPLVGWGAVIPRRRQAPPGPLA